MGTGGDLLPAVTDDADFEHCHNDAEKLDVCIEQCIQSLRLLFSIADNEYQY